MSDWEVGDLALCCDAGPPKIFDGRSECHPRWTSGLMVGAIYEVDLVALAASGKRIGLRMKEGVGGVSTRFTKVTPESADEFDRETIALMKEKVA